ncbi:pyrimidine/purine nucleoside phosphorylase [Paenibacillus silviterrae]|uniref:pyrimidine/purine nucleoside phosphorylase n=1 Tax=Paenibacillus silviterrae TaxID=3242194 RepID=UPI0025439EBB|nr:pyrimidine/purine nucleoside phosphorylase [Paenibacillus chinjuensis]
MSQFENVTVATKANVYFDGKVTSRTVLFADGTKKTLGIMMPGEYEFGTDVKEIMEIQQGELKVLLPDQTEWLQISGSGEFTVPAGKKFKLEVTTVTDYICSYIQE